MPRVLLATSGSAFKNCIGGYQEERPKLRDGLSQNGTAAMAEPSFKPRIRLKKGGGSIIQYAIMSHLVAAIAYGRVVCAKISSGFESPKRLAVLTGTPVAFRWRPSSLGPRLCEP